MITLIQKKKESKFRRKINLSVLAAHKIFVLFLIENRSQSVFVLFLKTRSTFFFNLQKSFENKSKIARDQSVSYVLSRIFDRFSALSRKEALLSQLMEVHALTVKLKRLL